MNKFQKIYNQILLQQQFYQFKNKQIKYKWFDNYQIINQYVQEQQLLVIPKQFFIDICKNIHTKQFQILQYNYKKIYQLLKNYNFQQSKQLKQKLNKLHGNLYICSSKQITQNNLNQMMKIYNILLNTFNEEQIERIIYLIGLNVSGITSTLEQFSIQNYNNVFIFINQNKIISNSWKETLQHQLTHFLQRILGKQNLLKRTKQIVNGNISLYVNNKKFFDQLYCNSFNKSFSQFSNYIIKQTQQHTTIKNILNRFQKFYQSQNKQNNFKNIQKRQKWLNKFLNKINDNNYLKSQQWNNYIQFLKKYQQQQLNIAEKHYYNLIFALLAYFIYKKFFNSYYDIDNLLKQQI